MKYAFIKKERQHHSLVKLCKAVGVSRSGYNDWLTRGPSKRSLADEALLLKIKEVDARHRGHAGSLKTWKVLNLEGTDCGRHRITRLRKQHNIVAIRRKRFIATTRSKSNVWAAPNRLERDFSRDRPNEVWVGDVTFIPLRKGFVYLAVLIDLHSRYVVGWSMSKRNNVALNLGALDMAITQRGPEPGLIHHSDRGRPYAGKEYLKRLEKEGITTSMSRKGDCWDNAVAESFFATLEFELIEQRSYASQDEVRSKVFEFIEVYYNRQRAHQTLGYKTPAAFEEEYEQNVA